MALNQIPRLVWVVHYPHLPYICREAYWIIRLDMTVDPFLPEFPLDLFHDLLLPFLQSFFVDCHGVNDGPWFNRRAGLKKNEKENQWR